ncbi:MAG: hypothetical protein V4858_17585 [Pseudomonadota bacterium]
MQFIDVRDLGAWCVLLAMQRRPGVVHGIGPSGTMADVLEACRQGAGSSAEYVWCADADLVRAQVAPWTGLPLWIPQADPDFGGMLLARTERAVQAGLSTRPWVDTARDTLAWAREAGSAAALTKALAPEAEAELLAAMPHHSD